MTGMLDTWKRSRARKIWYVPQPLFVEPREFASLVPVRFEPIHLRQQHRSLDVVHVVLPSEYGHVPVLIAFSMTIIGVFIHTMKPQQT